MSSRLAVFTEIILPSFISTPLTLSPIRKTPPAASNAVLSIICVLTPGTEGGSVPMKQVLPPTAVLTSSTSSWLLSPKTAGSISVSPSSNNSLTLDTNLSRASLRLIILAMLEDLISLGFFLNAFVSSVDIAAILHFTPLFSNASAMNEVLKSRKPSILTINAFSPISMSFEVKMSISSTVSQVLFGSPEADIIHPFLPALSLTLIPQDLRKGSISAAYPATFSLPIIL